MSHSDNNLWDIRVGDVLDRLREMPDESVHTCVTSPPYFGLRDYGTAPWEGGDPACDHKGAPFRTKSSINQNWNGSRDVKNAADCEFFKDVCGKCGAIRIDKQIGLEPTPEAFIQKMVEVFREVRRTLRSDGTLWLNIGDSYCNTDKWGGGGNVGKNTLDADGNVLSWAVRKKRQHMPGLKPKDLIGIPWMLALALRADGWYLRSDIVWAKPNVMPESVTDRPTKAHEYLFLLTKSARYFYDAEAIKEPISPKTLTVNTTPRKGTRGRVHGEKMNKWMEENGGRYHPSKRNKRTVWSVASQPFKGAHFATFPPKLIEPCILSGTSAYGCCISCGAPWKQEQVRTNTERADFRRSRFDTGKTAARDGGDRTQAGGRFVSVSGNWTPSCDCVPNSPVPCTVLDPFAGAGTTLLVATQHGRASIGIELNPEYAEITRQRLLAPPKPKKQTRKKPPEIASKVLPPPSLQTVPLFIQ